MNVNSFISRYNETIYYREWLCEGPSQAILIIVHGMAEHSSRYDEFAKFLNTKKISVFAHDHRGHGLTVTNKYGDINHAKLGFFSNSKGWKIVIDETFDFINYISQKFSRLQIFLLGHSMGSFIVRNLLAIYPDLKVAGVILSGTTWGDKFKLLSGKYLANFLSLFGPEKQSKFLTGIAFAGFLEPFKPLNTKYDWLSRDIQRNIDYSNDPLCGFYCSRKFFADLSNLILYSQNLKNIEKIDKNLPILIASGTMDPVGEFGKGPKKYYEVLKQMGFNAVNLKLYENARHELLNEINRKEVYEDFYKWLVTFIDYNS